MKAVSRHPISPGPLRRARGFTLVELMVSITVALFLIGGILTVVQHTRSTFTVQNQLAQLQDSERIAMTLIAGVVQTAGYYPAPNSTLATSALPVTTTAAVKGAFATAGTPSIQGGTAPTGYQGDTITVRYAVAQGDNAFNCLGGTNTTVAPYETWENTFRVKNNQLVCSVLSQSTDSATGDTVLVNGVTNLQITYGVNTKGISSANSCVDTYITSQLMATANWPNVCSVVVTLTFLNPAAPPGGANQTVTFTRVIAVMNMVGVTT